ncbi:dicarboxylate/amino acid:cation symporter [Croceibacterium aestuarii]|uniref:dicarboxylate/amino acid:cation symporter n=1 Tax=Croceibacterium aestuarii TaxID=3064139 RepID=UPI00272E78C1|nr:dicarboxylate/amino acid:cation symporter [Croceibacterium sp. D39]
MLTDELLRDVTPERLIRLYHQRTKMRLWVRSRLWAQVLIAMALGVLAGWLLGPAPGLVPRSTAEAIGGWLALPGQLFLGLIAIVLVPLVFSSIVGGLAATPSSEAMRAIGLRLGLYILLSTSLAATIGVSLALAFTPGERVDVPVPAVSPLPSAVPAFDIARLPDLVAGVLPTNPAASIIQGDLLAIVILALLTGVAVTRIQKSKADTLLALLDGVLSVSMTIVQWAMLLSPLAVFGLMAKLMIQVGADSLLGLVAYVGTVLLGLVLLFLGYLLLLTAVGRIGPGRFLARAGQTLVLAFSTSSSSAVMPGTIQTARRFGVPDRVASMVVPIGATMNMAGTALYQSVAILFLAQISGIELGSGQLLLIIGTLVASSIGAPGTPGVSMGILASVAAGFGIPAAGLVIILGVDRLLDMSRTVVNVTGDMAASVLLKDALGDLGKSGGTT